jgi:hypothetical protein
MRYAILLAALLTASGNTSEDVDALSWMAGCWSFTQGDLIVDEAWLGPRAGLMMGVSRTVRGDRIVATERLEIADDSAGVVYRAWPSRQAPAVFRAVHVSSTSAVFENAAHDFPQRIAYSLREDGDLLHARVESMDGSDGFDFPYRRVACTAGG